MNRGIEPTSSNQSKKIFIISFPNTVIQPFAMMIEVINTSIAFSTVFSLDLNMSLTHRAVKFVLLRLYCKSRIEITHVLHTLIPCLFFLCILKDQLDPFSWQ